MVRRRWFASLVVLAACGRSDSPPSPSSSRVTPAVAPPPPYRCFDLPGAMRWELELSPDGTHAIYAQSEGQTDAVYSLDLASGQARPLVSGLSSTLFSVLGDTLATMRKPSGEDTFDRLYIGDVEVTDGTVRASEPVADPVTRAFYYATYPDGPVILWKFPLGARAPQRMREGYLPLAVIPEGRLVVMDETTRKRQTPRIMTLPIAGGEPTLVLTSELKDAGVARTHFVFTPDGAPAQPPMSVSFEGPPARLIPGGKPHTKVIGRGDPLVLVEEGESPDYGGPLSAHAHRPLWTTQGLTRTSVAELVGVDVASAALLPDGRALVAIVVHDTDASGHFDYGDEGDVCLIPVSPDEVKAFTPPTRHLPLRLVKLVPRIEEAATRVLGEKVRVGYEPDVIDPDTLILTVAGDGPADLREAAARTVTLAGELAPITAEPQLGLAVRWERNHRMAAYVFDGNRKGFVARAGGYGLLQDVPASRSKVPTQWLDLLDIVATDDRIRMATGALAQRRILPPSPNLTTFEHGEEQYELPGLPAMPAFRQDEVARTLWDELEGHRKRMHPKLPPPDQIQLQDGPTISAGKIVR